MIKSGSILVITTKSFSAIHICTYKDFNFTAVKITINSKLKN